MAFQGLTTQQRGSLWLEKRVRIALLRLIEEIWGMDSDSEERTVDVHIKRLRDKFYRWDDFEIVTVRGLGYKAVKRG